MQASAIPLYIIYASSIMLNSFLIHALRKIKKLNTTSYRCVLYLSVSDILVGLFGTLQISISIARNELSQGVFLATWKISSFCNLFFLNATLNFILIIAIDRFFHMKYLVRYNSVMTKGKEAVLVLANVIFTMHTMVIAYIIPMFQTDWMLRNYNAYVIYKLILSFIYITLVFSIFAIYTLTYVSIRKRIGNGGSINDGPTPNTVSNINVRHRNRRSPDQEFAKSVVFIVISLLICSLPNLCVAMANNIIGFSRETKSAHRDKIFSHLFEWTYFTVVMNGSLNVIILISCSRQLRQYTRRTFSSFTNMTNESVVESVRTTALWRQKDTNVSLA